MTVVHMLKNYKLFPMQTLVADVQFNGHVKIVDRAETHYVFLFPFSCRYAAVKNFSYTQISSFVHSHLLGIHNRQIYLPSYIQGPTGLSCNSKPFRVNYI